MPDKEKTSRGDIKNIGGVPGADLSVVRDVTVDKNKEGGGSEKANIGKKAVRVNDPPVRESYGVVGPAIPEQARAENPKPNPNQGKTIVNVYIDAGGCEKSFVDSVEDGKELAKNIAREGIWKDRNGKLILYPSHKVLRIDVI